MGYTQLMRNTTMRTKTMTTKTVLKFSRTKLRNNLSAYFITLNKSAQDSALDYLDDKYHVVMKPFISDHEYDDLLGLHMEKFPKSKRLEKVGHLAERLSSKRPDVLLPYFMPSLDKVKPEQKATINYIRDYLGTFVLSDKLDGISIQVIYDKGVPILAYTRGNGEKGKDTTRHIPYMDIPQKIKYKGRVSLRAEAIIDLSVFNKFFAS